MDQRERGWCEIRESSHAKPWESNAQPAGQMRTSRKGCGRHLRCFMHWTVFLISQPTRTQRSAGCSHLPRHRIPLTPQTRGHEATNNCQGSWLLHLEVLRLTFGTMKGLETEGARRPLTRERQGDAGERASFRIVLEVDRLHLWSCSQHPLRAWLVLLAASSENLNGPAHSILWGLGCGWLFLLASLKLRALWSCYLVYNLL